MREEEFAELRQLAMAAAGSYGCHAAVELADFLASDVQLGGIRLKIVVAKRSASGALLTRESNVRLERHAVATAVEGIVRAAAAQLAKQ
jgi:hypothetical protein